MSHAFHADDVDISPEDVKARLDRAVVAGRGAVVEGRPAVVGGVAIEVEVEVDGSASPASVELVAPDWTTPASLLCSRAPFTRPPSKELRERDRR